MSKRSQAGAGPLARAVASEVKAEMARQDITHQVLSNRTGLSTTYLGKRLRGEFAFSLNDLEPVGRALNINPAELLERGLVAAARIRNGGHTGVPSPSDDDSPLG